MFAALPTRKTLRQAVRACPADFDLTAVPLPGLLVNLTGGEELGYVIVRAPFGLPDTVLAPTRIVIGSRTLGCSRLICRITSTLPGDSES